MNLWLKIPALLFFVFSVTWNREGSAAGAEKARVPLSSSSRWIVDSSGKRVKLRCINWAGHLETNIPEGLNKKAIEEVADWIRNQGFNCVRLTYSIDMALNPSVKVEDSFHAAAKAAGVPDADMMLAYRTAEEKNPFLCDAVVIDVFDRVQAALWERGVMTVLDNHVSQASWCCGQTDGNGWWSDAPNADSANCRFFDTPKWLAGLTAMAKWSKSRPGIVGMSLRNELRPDATQTASAAATWLDHMSRGGGAVHNENGELLVILGGINYATNLSPLQIGTLKTGAWGSKRVWEAHAYSNSVPASTCDAVKAAYSDNFGFVLQQGTPSTGPLFLSEFGVEMSGGAEDGLSGEQHAYLTCLVSYMEGNDADWNLWALQGSYYVRQQILDHDETWGALDHDWSDWRNPKFKALLGRMMDVSQGP